MGKAKNFCKAQGIRVSESFTTREGMGGNLKAINRERSRVGFFASQSEAQEEVIYRKET